MKKFFALAFILGSLWACKKSDDPVTANGNAINTQSLVINMNHFFDSSLLQLNSEIYYTSNGDSLTVSLFRYYLSNFYIQKLDNTWKKLNDQYILVDQADSDSKIFSVESIPVGQYKALRFIVGVDSLHNVSGAQSGALDPSNNMFWDWNSGYIFIKVEGLSNQSPVGNFLYHLGGFSGNNNIIQNIEIPFGQILSINDQVTPQLFMHADLAEIFRSPSTIDLSIVHHVTGGPDMITLANNYYDMFTLDSLSN